MNEEEKQQLREEILEEMVRRDIENVYDDDGYFSRASWKLKDNIREKVKKLVDKRVEEILEENKKEMNDTIESFICDILPSVVYDAITRNIDNGIKTVMQNTTDMAVCQSINRLRQNLRF